MMDHIYLIEPIVFQYQCGKPEQIQGEDTGDL